VALSCAQASPLCSLGGSSLRLSPSALLLCLGVSFRDEPPFLLLRRSADQKRLGNRLPTRRGSIFCHVVPQEKIGTERLDMGNTTARFVATFGDVVWRSTRSWRRTSLRVSRIRWWWLVMCRRRGTPDLLVPLQSSATSSGCLLQCVCIIPHTLSY
jgi:hypothetical protein